jgi:hypothetical protein
MHGKSGPIVFQGTACRHGIALTHNLDAARRGRQIGLPGGVERETTLPIPLRRPDMCRGYVHWSSEASTWRHLTPRHYVAKGEAVAFWCGDRDATRPLSADAVAA